MHFTSNGSLDGDTPSLPPPPPDSSNSSQVFRIPGGITPDNTVVARRDVVGGGNSPGSPPPNLAPMIVADTAANRHPPAEICGVDFMCGCLQALIRQSLISLPHQLESLLRTTSHEVCLDLMAGMV